MSYLVETLFKSDPAGNYRNRETTQATRLKTSVPPVQKGLSAVSPCCPLTKLREQFFKQISSVVLAGLFVSPANAHSPHDVVDSLAISPHYSQDSTLYSIVRGNLLKSINKGETWKRLVNGIDANFGLYSVTIDPTSPNVLYLASATDGIYKSEDAGNSWRKINKGLQKLLIRQLYLPRSSNQGLVYAADSQGALYRTSDGGANWSKAYANPSPISSISGHGCDLLENCRVWIGDRDGKLSFSGDGGSTWNTLFERADCGAINSLGIPSMQPSSNIYFLGTEKCGVFRTGDAGQSFQQVNKGIGNLNIRSIALSSDFDNDQTVFASTWHKAIYVSSDAGQTWKKYSDGLTTEAQADKAHLPQFRDILLSPNYPNDKTVFLGGFNGLFRSRNGGVLWEELAALPGSLIQSVSLSPTYHLDKTLAITTYTGGIYKSNDDGVNWQNMATEILENRNNDIAFSPAYASDKTIFASIGSSVVGKSSDRGNSWSAYDVPTKKLPSIIAISSTFATDHTLFVGTRFGDINKSTDGGISYTTVFSETLTDICRSSCLSALVISPSYSEDHLLLVATRNKGIQISKDGGNTWITKIPSSVLGYDVKLALSPNYSVDHAIFIGGNKGLFLSTDELASWNKLSTSSSGVEGQVKELAVSPDFANDRTILIMVKGKGLFKSVDGGNTFEQIDLKSLYNNEFSLYSGFPAASSSSIRFSPAYSADKTIYATTSEKLFRSRDGGNHWAPVLNNLSLKNQ